MGTCIIILITDVIQLDLTVHSAWDRAGGDGRLAQQECEGWRQQQGGDLAEGGGTVTAVCVAGLAEQHPNVTGARWAGGTHAHGLVGHLPGAGADHGQITAHWKYKNVRVKVMPTGARRRVNASLFLMGVSGGTYNLRTSE